MPQLKEGSAKFQYFDETTHFPQSLQIVFPYLYDHQLSLMWLLAIRNVAPIIYNVASAICNMASAICNMASAVCNMASMIYNMTTVNRIVSWLLQSVI